MDLTWRPLTLDDVPALARLSAAAEAVDRTGEHVGEADLREDLRGPNIDLVRAGTGAWLGGELVAGGLVRRRDAADPVRLHSAVHPDHRTDALGAHLVEWFSRTGREVHERAFPHAPLELQHGHHQNERWIGGILAGAGFTHARTMVTMRVGLAATTGAAPPTSLPPGATWSPARRTSARTCRTWSWTATGSWRSS